MRVTFLILSFFCSLATFSQTSKDILDSTITDLLNGKMELVHARFSDEMKESITKEKLKSIWVSLNLQLGAVVATHPEDVKEDSDGILYIVPIEFTTMWINAQFHFSKNNEIDGLFFSPGAKRIPYTLPTYADTALFVEKSIEIPVNDVFLSGKICLPKNVTNPKVVILVHGSGPNDMDETAGPNKIFKDIAYGLASNQIAVIRYNKRTQELPQLLNAEKLTFKEEVTEDVAQLIKMIKQGNWAVDSNHIYVLGHSLGGMLAPKIAAENSIKGIIIAAGNARPLEDLIEEQFHYIYSLDGTITEYEKRDLAEITKKAAVIRKNKYSIDTPASQLLLGLNANYWKTLTAYSPTKTALSLPATTRILVLQGKRDYQVLYEKDFAVWQKTLQKRKDTHFIAYPSLNHLFLPGEGKSTPEEYEKYHPFFEQTLQDIIRWIKN